MNEAKRYYQLTEDEVAEDAKRMAMWGAYQWQRLMTSMPMPPAGYLYEPVVDAFPKMKGQDARFEMRVSLRRVPVPVGKRQVKEPAIESANKEAIRKAVGKVARDKKKKN